MSDEPQDEDARIGDSESESETRKPERLGDQLIGELSEPPAGDDSSGLPLVRRVEAAAWRERLETEWGIPVYVIPVDGTKKPAVRQWTTRAAGSREAVAALWGPRELGVGVACGKTGVWVLDLDVSLDELETSHDPEQRELAKLLRRVIDVKQTRVLLSSTRNLPHFIWQQPAGGVGGDDQIPQARLRRLMAAGDVAKERSGPSMGDLRSAGGQIALSGRVLVDVPVASCPPDIVQHVLKCCGDFYTTPVVGGGVKSLAQEEIDEFIYGQDSHRELAGGVTDAERAGYLAQLGPSFYKKLTRDGGMHRHDAMYATMKTAFIESLAGGYRLADAVDMLESVYREAYEGGVAGRDVRQWAGDREIDFRGIVRGRCQEAVAGAYDEAIEQKRSEKGWYPARELEAMVDWAIASITAEANDAKTEEAAAEQIGAPEPEPVTRSAAEAEEAAVPLDAVNADGAAGYNQYAAGGLESLRERVDELRNEHVEGGGENAPEREREAEPRHVSEQRARAGDIEPGSAEWHRLVSVILEGQRALGGVDSVRLAEEVAKQLGRLEVQALAREGWKLRSQPAVELVDGLDLSVVIPEPPTWLKDTRKPVSTAAAVIGVPGLLPAGSTTLMFGASGSFKTMLALVAVRDVLRAGGRVLYLDWEMGLEKLVPRLRAMGVTQAEAKRIFYAWQPGDMGPEMDVYRSRHADLVVIDSVTRVLNSYAGLTAGGSNDNDAFTRWIQERAEPLIDAGREGVLADGKHGAAVLLVDHVGHDAAERARGASAKKDAVSQVLSVQKTQDLDVVIGRSGICEVTVRKSRMLGLVEGHVRVCEFKPPAPAALAVGRGGTGEETETAGSSGGVVELATTIRAPGISDAALAELRREEATARVSRGPVKDGGTGRSGPIKVSRLADAAAAAGSYAVARCERLLEATGSSPDDFHKLVLLCVARLDQESRDGAFPTLQMLRERVDEWADGSVKHNDVKFAVMALEASDLVVTDPRGRARLPKPTASERDL